MGFFMVFPNSFFIGSIKVKQTSSLSVKHLFDAIILVLGKTQPNGVRMIKGEIFSLLFL